MQFDRVEIGYGQRADTRSGKVGQCGGTQTAAADDQNMRVGKLLLPFDADFVQKDVSAVPQQECIVVVVFGRGHDDVWKKTVAGDCNAAVGRRSTSDDISGNGRLKCERFGTDAAFEVHLQYLRQTREKNHATAYPE